MFNILPHGFCGISSYSLLVHGNILVLPNRSVLKRLQLAELTLNTFGSFYLFCTVSCAACKPPQQSYL